MLLPDKQELSCRRQKGVMPLQDYSLDAALLWQSSMTLTVSDDVVMAATRRMNGDVRQQTGIVGRCQSASSPGVLFTKVRTPVSVFKFGVRKFFRA